MTRTASIFRIRSILDTPPPLNGRAFRAKRGLLRRCLKTRDLRRYWGSAGSLFEFGLAHDCPAELAPAASCSLTFTFSPTPQEPPLAAVGVDPRLSAALSQILAAGHGCAVEYGGLVDIGKPTVTLRTVIWIGLREGGAGQGQSPNGSPCYSSNGRTIPVNSAGTRPNLGNTRESSCPGSTGCWTRWNRSRAHWRIVTHRRLHAASGTPILSGIDRHRGVARNARPQTR